MKRLWLVAVVLAGCPSATKSKVVDAGTRVSVAKLEPLVPVGLAQDDGGVDQYFKIKVLTPVGPQVPDDVVTVTLSGEKDTWDGAAKRVLLVPIEDAYLAQAAALLARLDDAGAEVWLKHPDANIAFGLQLRDEPSFQAWLDEPVAGKLRVIHREDGFELQTNLGKLPGPDINGPTVPVRGGKMDLTTLQSGFEKISGRFKGAPDVCFVPAFGMSLNDTARAMAANFTDATKAYFPTTCLVYPRPRARVVDGGQ
jgi:hypothetical protein